MAFKAAILLFLAYSVTYCINGLSLHGFIRPGGLSEERPATEFVQNLVAKAQMKRRAEEYLKKRKPFKMFEAVSFATQVVAGTNYFIKVQVGKENFIHIRVFKPLPFLGEKPNFVAAIEKKSKTDKITYFEKRMPPMQLSSFISGGLSEEKTATADVQELALRFKEDAEKQLKKPEPYEMFRAVKYAKQVVAGTNFFIKVQVGKNDYIHLRVFKPLPFNKLPPNLDATKDKQGKDDKIEYF